MRTIEITLRHGKRGASGDSEKGSCRLEQMSEREPYIKLILSGDDLLWFYLKDSNLIETEIE